MIPDATRFHTCHLSSTTRILRERAWLSDCIIFLSSHLTQNTLFQRCSSQLTLGKYSGWRMKKGHCSLHAVSAISSGGCCHLSSRSKADANNRNKYKYYYADGHENEHTPLIYDHNLSRSLVETAFSRVWRLLEMDAIIVSRKLSRWSANTCWWTWHTSNTASAISTNTRHDTWVSAWLI